MQEKTRGHAFQQQRRGAGVAKEFRQADKEIGPHDAHRGIGARRSAGISNTVSGPDVRDIRSDALDDARRFHSGDAAGRNQIEAPATTIDVDEVDSDC